MDKLLAENAVPEAAAECSAPPPPKAGVGVSFRMRLAPGGHGVAFA
jgi:hypothetical protein